MYSVKLPAARSNLIALPERLRVLVGSLMAKTMPNAVQNEPMQGIPAHERDLC
jgi:hypothetical protein